MPPAHIRDSLKISSSTAMANKYLKMETNILVSIKEESRKGRENMSGTQG